jgi:formylglycine-generating enzyme required for sulfatase activity
VAIIPEPAELEIELTGLLNSQNDYQVGLRFHLPGSDADPELLQGRMPIAHFRPAGAFRMGNDDLTAPPTERPAHDMRLPAYRIGKHPLKVREYAAFIKARKEHPAPLRLVQPQAARRQPGAAHDRRELGRRHGLLHLAEQADGPPLHPTQRYRITLELEYGKRVLPLS